MAQSSEQGEGEQVWGGKWRGQTNLRREDSDGVVWLINGSGLGCCRITARWWGKGKRQWTAGSPPHILFSADWRTNDLGEAQALVDYLRPWLTELLRTLPL